MAWRKPARSASWSAELRTTPTTAIAVANLVTYRGTNPGGFPGEAVRAAREEGMQALGEDMAAAVAIHPRNLIPTLLLPRAKWALPESTRKKPLSFAFMAGDLTPKPGCNQALL
jgi:hypothetical protein